MGVRGTGRGWRVRSAAVVAIAGLLTALMAVVVPSAASAATVDVTGGTSLHLLSQSFTTTSGAFCNVIWVAYVPVTQGVDNYDVQVHDNNPLGQGPYQTAFPYANDTFFDGNVTSYPELPFGGVKASGYGRELTAHGIREFCNLTAVWVGDE